MSNRTDKNTRSLRTIPAPPAASFPGEITDDVIGDLHVWASTLKFRRDYPGVEGEVGQNNGGKPLHNWNTSLEKVTKGFKEVNSILQGIPKRAGREELLEQFDDVLDKIDRRRGRVIDVLQRGSGHGVRPGEMSAKPKGADMSACLEEYKLLRNEISRLRRIDT